MINFTFDKIDSDIFFFIFSLCMNVSDLSKYTYIHTLKGEWYYFMTRYAVIE